MEEQPRDEQPKPDDEAEQAHHIDDGQSADAFLHELAEVRHHADGEEGEQEEDDAERVPETLAPVFCSSGDWRQMMRRMANVMI